LGKGRPHFAVIGGSWLWDLEFNNAKPLQCCVMEFKNVFGNIIVHQLRRTLAPAIQAVVLFFVLLQFDRCNECQVSVGRGRKPCAKEYHIKSTDEARSWKNKVWKTRNL
jgi:hypothetical protein